MDLLWISLIVGLLLGTILSVVFGVYSKTTSEPYIRMLFGLSSYDLIFDGIIIIISAGFLFLTVVAIVVRDTAYPIAKPLNFTLETMMMTFLSSSVLLAMAPLRGQKIDLETLKEFGILSVKFGALHLLLQFSGFYSNVFPPVVIGAKR
jgi:heme/copper-type cytochrome/quinol oxidase subunit 3